MEGGRAVSRIVPRTIISCAYFPYVPLEVHASSVIQLSPSALALSEFSWHLKPEEAPIFRHHSEPIRGVGWHSSDHLLKGMLD